MGVGRARRSLQVEEGSGHFCWYVGPVHPQNWWTATSDWHMLHDWCVSLRPNGSEIADKAKSEIQSSYRLRAYTVSSGRGSKGSGTVHQKEHLWAASDQKWPSLCRNRVHWRSRAFKSELTSPFCKHRTKALFDAQSSIPPDPESFMVPTIAAVYKGS